MCVYQPAWNPAKLAGGSSDRLITAEPVGVGHFILVLSKHSPSLSSVSQSTALSPRSLCNNVVEDMLLAGKEIVWLGSLQRYSAVRDHEVSLRLVLALLFVQTEQEHLIISVGGNHEIDSTKWRGVRVARLVRSRPCRRW